MPSCWLFGNGKFYLKIDNTNAILIGQNLATISLDIDLLDKNFNKFIIGLFFFFNILSGCKISEDQRPIIIYFINQMSFIIFFFFFLFFFFSSSFCRRKMYRQLQSGLSCTQVSQHPHFSFTQTPFHD